MSANNLNKNDEFDGQLRMQESYGGDTHNDPNGETDSRVPQPADSPYEWDQDKRAWFPRVTEDFLATYQANYGFSSDGVPRSFAYVQDSGSKSVEELPQRKTPEPTDPQKKGEKRKTDSGWFHVEEDKNTNVYVSGLPPDITVDEFIQLMSKFGIIMRDPQTEEFKVKLYKDSQGNLKGDGLCCYLKRESVELALKLLDEDEIRGYRLHVEVAKFHQKGEYDVSKKKKKCRDYKKKLFLQQKELDWRPERKAGSSRRRHERVVIIKNMFHPVDFEDDPLVLNEIREDLQVECSKFGQIKTLFLFDRHPDGVASVSFKDPKEADRCIQILDGRWFGGRQITAHAWDGTTDYRVEETSREREERLRGWEAFLNAPEAHRGLQRPYHVSSAERTGPSKVRQHPYTSNVKAQEAPTRMASIQPKDEKKSGEIENGEEFGDAASGKDAREDGPEKEKKESCPSEESEGSCSKTEWEAEDPKKGLEDSSKREVKENGSERESRKIVKNDCEEKGLAQDSEDDDANKEPEKEHNPNSELEEKESNEACSAKQSEEGSEEEIGENSLGKDSEEDGFESEDNDTDKPEFDGSSQSMLGGRPWQKEEEEDTDEKEGEDPDEKEENPNKKLDSDKKEKEEDATLKDDEDDTKLLRGNSFREKSFDDEKGSNKKVFDDSDGGRWVSLHRQQLCSQ
ncbi:LOW QUALITY PROTEIN: 17S U2 SnRNP complex component HTATSF1-like [Thomomys bottae]